MPRSVLYVPASRPRMLAKFASLPADFLLLDLEDGVAPGAKGAAREALAAAAGEGLLPAHRNWGIRVNGSGLAGGEDYENDLRLAEEPGEVARFCERCGSFDADAGLMIETAAGLGRVRELAAVPGVAMLIYGSADLRLSLGARPDRERSWERHAMGEILLAARMHGRTAIDAVYFRFRDREGLVRDAEIARGLGFDGKSCIHPSQLAPVHQVFSAAPEETAWAEKVLSAWEELDGEARGVIVVDGEMVESLHLRVARKILGG